MRRKVFVIWVLAAVFLFPLTVAFGAGTGGSRKITLTLTKAKVDYSSRKGTVKISLAGKTENVPPGTKIALLLMYNFSEVGRCLVTIKADGSFGETVLTSSMPLPPDKGYEIQMQINPDDQATRLKKPTEALLARSEYTPLVKTVVIGTPSQIEAARVKTVKFVKDILKRVIAANNELVDEVEAAETKAKYQKDGKFDSAEWRKFMDERWRPKMVKIQREFEKWLKKNPAYKFKYRAGVTYLSDLLRTVALRSVLRSRKLYALMRKRPAREDITLPADLQIQPRYGKVRSDTKAKKYLIKCYKIVQEDFKLVRPKKKTPPAAAAKGTKSGKKKAETKKKKSKK